MPKYDPTMVYVRSANSKFFKVVKGWNSEILIDAFLYDQRLQYFIVLKKFGF